MRFRDRYRIPSARRPGWDYATPGLYFVTCCTAGRRPLFGHLDDGSGTRLSPLGHRVAVAWHRVPLLHPSVRLDALVVMPDHVHALVELTDAQGPSLASLVRHAKGAVTREAPEASGPIWQPRFHDRIVRDAREHAAVRRYIAANPAAAFARTAAVETHH